MAPKVVARRYKWGASQGCDITCAKVGLWLGSNSSIDDTNSENNRIKLIVARVGNNVVWILISI